MKPKKVKRTVPKPHQYYDYMSTVLVKLDDGPLRDSVIKVAESEGFKVYEVEVWQDVVAVPAFLAVVNPDLFPAKEWKEICGWYREMADPDKKVFLTKKSLHSSKLPAGNLIKRPKKVDDYFIKFMMAKTKATRRRREKRYEKKENQIVRLVYMIHQLENGKTVRLANVAEKFGVSLRTVQRDLQVLEMAYVPIVDGKHPGSYKLVEGTTFYDRYFG